MICIEEILMPVKCSVKPKYRVVTTKTGKMIRLAWCQGKVIEAKRVWRNKNE